MPRLRHYDHLGTVRFITFSCYQREPLLTDPFTCEIVLTELSRMRRERDMKLLGYVIMPDHVHLVLLPPEGARLGPVIGAFKTRVAHTILDCRRRGPRRNWRIAKRASGELAVWQRRCYDHNCRTVETVIEKINYCHQNPVKQGLVTRTEDWAWSSCRWYLGCRDGVMEIDGIEM